MAVISTLVHSTMFDPSLLGRLTSESRTAFILYHFYFWTSVLLSNDSNGVRCLIDITKFIWVPFNPVGSWIYFTTSWWAMLQRSLDSLCPFRILALAGWWHVFLNICCSLLIDLRNLRRSSSNVYLSSPLGEHSESRWLFKLSSLPPGSPVSIDKTGPFIEWSTGLWLHIPFRDSIGSTGLAYHQPQLQVYSKPSHQQLD